MGEVGTVRELNLRSPPSEGLVVPHLNAGDPSQSTITTEAAPLDLGASTAALVRSWPEFQISRAYSLSLRIAAAKRTLDVAQAVGNGRFFWGSRRRSGNQSAAFSYQRRNSLF